MFVTHTPYIENEIVILYVQNKKRFSPYAQNKCVSLSDQNKRLILFKMSHHVQNTYLTNCCFVTVAFSLLSLFRYCLYFFLTFTFPLLSLFRYCRFFVIVIFCYCHFFVTITFSLLPFFCVSSNRGIQR